MQSNLAFLLFFAAAVVGAATDVTITQQQTGKVEKGQGVSMVVNAGKITLVWQDQIFKNGFE